jgi:hypothetical protein
MWLTFLLSLPYSFFSVFKEGSEAVAEEYVFDEASGVGGLR